MTYLSSNLTLEESYFSQTASRLGIDNYPPHSCMDRITFAAYSLEAVRTELGDKPLLISSWYRSPALNVAVHGAQGSGHLHGDCVDFTCPTFGTVDEIVKKLLESAIDFNKIIREFNRWVHIDFSGTQRTALIIDSMGTRAYA